LFGDSVEVPPCDGLYVGTGPTRNGPSPGPVCVAELLDRPHPKPDLSGLDIGHYDVNANAQPRSMRCW
jgi:hypothetical protein